MRKFLPRHPSPALTVAFVALLVALGSTAYAAITIPKNSVGTKQLKNGAVTTKKIKNGAVTKSKINTSGLTVPNALHATSADTAGSATNAANAVTAQTATVGGPIAFAAVNANGTVVTAHSRGIASANITTAGAASYCFNGVPSFAVALTSVGYGAATAPFNESDSATVGYPDYRGTAIFNANCPGDQLEVTTEAGGGFTQLPFTVAFYK